MWGLTSADKGRRDSGVSFRHSKKKETGLQSLLNSSLHLSTLRPGAAVDNHMLIYCSAQGYYGYFMFWSLSAI